MFLSDVFVLVTLLRCRQPKLIHGETVALTQKLTDVLFSWFAGLGGSTRFLRKLMSLLQLHHENVILNGARFPLHFQNYY